MAVNKLVYFSIIMVTMALAGCRPNEIPLQPTISSQPLASPSPTIPVTPTASATASPTAQIKYPLPPVPTISPATQQKIVALLNLKNCIMPCYMGITPGITTWSDAKKLLDSSGAAYLGPGKNDGQVTSYSYAMHSDSKNVLNKWSDSLFDLLLWVDNNGIVQKIFASFMTNDVGHILPEYWIKNSPQNVFSQIGIPDAMYTSISGGYLVLVYQDRGVILIYHAFWFQNFLCPGNETHLNSMLFMLTNPASQLDLYYPEQDVTQLPSVWVPIEQRMNISARQFYDKVLVDSSACFELKP